MEKAPNNNSARATLATLLVLTAIALLCALPFVATSHAQSPASGSISPGTASPVAWNGTLTSPGGAIMESACADNVNCENYTLTVTGQPSDWAGKKVQITLTWMENTATEYDIYIHNAANTVITSAMQGPGLTSQVAFIDPASAGTGIFRIHVAYATTPTSATDHYHGAATVVSAQGGGGTPSATPVPAPIDTAGNVGYENFEAPGVLTPTIVTSSGGATVEYFGRNSGEPSVGVNWRTTSPSVGGMLNFQSDLQTLFVSIDESNSPTIPKATWVDRRAPSSVAVDSDPIGFTDRATGRVFASELTLLSPDTSKISFSDNDGVTWIFDPQQQGPASAVDHQTIGGGPYHAPLFAPPPPAYPNAVYYCSQDIGAAFCARSDNGGTTLGTQVPIYAVNQCGGLHGHVKVAPDGSVYVPNRACGGNTAVVVSTDNGITWTVRPVLNGSVPATPASDDPAVAIDGGGKVYCLFSLGGTTAAIGISSDQGATWRNIYDLSTAFGIKNVAFPAAVAGDAGRAAVAFYGSVTGTGDSSAENFTGVWHLYVSHTFDGGAHWTTTDVTPTLPMQRLGLLRGGGGPLDRNLLDFFDAAVDRDGRVIIGYVNGCAGGPCSQAPVNPDGSSGVIGNAYTATATIARESSGRRLFAANDPANATSIPGMPFVTQVRIGNTVRLAWNEADTGNLPISTYHILRGTTSGSEVQFQNVAGNLNSFTDNSATDPNQTYYYKVVAENNAGQSPARNEVAAPYIGDRCSGLIIHRNLPNHPESTGGTASQPPLPQLLIDYIAVGEPPNTNNFKFTIKVGNLATLPPNSRWRMVWDTIATPDEQFYVGMNTDSNSVVTFEYGTVTTLSVVVVGVPTENPKGTPDRSSNYNVDGTITIIVPKAALGNPSPGDLLGAVNGRTFNTPGPAERSTLLIDNTFVKGNLDSSFPAATYTVGNNTACAAVTLAPVGAVSRKTHSGAGAFDVDLPLTGARGSEDRTGGLSGDHQVIVTFAAPVTSIQGATVTPATGKTASVSGPPAVNNTQVTVNLTNVTNEQTLAVNLIGVVAGSNSGNVSIPMGILLGDSTGDGTVNSGDAQETRNRSGQLVDLTNYRSDINLDGTINSGDAIIARSKSGTGLMANRPDPSQR